jgi:putative ABC transport system permease protein
LAVDRVNRSSGTWQDSAAFLDLKLAQKLFDLPGRISRIEAIECTGEQCKLTGLKSEAVLANELARITDQATILRRETIAEARSRIRGVSQENLRLLQNALWMLLALSIVALSSLNSYQRKSEVGVLQALGYGQGRVLAMFILRAVMLTIPGAALGIVVGAIAALTQSQPLFHETGDKLSIDWQSAIPIGIVATVLAALASSLPALIAAMRNPAEIIGKEN